VNTFDISKKLQLRIVGFLVSDKFKKEGERNVFSKSKKSSKNIRE
jgi:hypothetical protein